MFGDGGGQIVIPDLPGDAVQLLKCVNVTTDKGLETLAVRELQILHPAVPVNESEGVELPLIALVVERFEVTPVGLEAFARLWFHTHEGSLRLQLRAYFVHVLAQNAAATGVAQRAEPLPDHGGAGGRILFEQLGDGGLIRIEFAGPGPSRGSLGRHVQILLDRVPAHVQVALDLADRPVVGPVQAMQVVDLFGRKHGLDPHLYAQGVAGTRAMFFTRFRWEGDNPLKDHDFGESYVVLYKIGRIRPNQPNLCGGML